MDFDLGKVLTILVPTLGGWGAAWLANRRERRQYLERQGAAQDERLAKQEERLVTGWSEMTAQARDIIGRLQVETIEAKTRAALAEEGKAKAERDLSEIRSRLEKELAEVRSMYDMARAELDSLKERGKRAMRKRDVSAADHEQQ